VDHKSGLLLSLLDGLVSSTWRKGTSGGTLRTRAVLRDSLLTLSLLPDLEPHGQYQATFRSVDEHLRKRAEANSLFGVVISPFLRAGYQRQAGRIQDDHAPFRH
jgi:hypothetical protein